MINLYRLIRAIFKPASIKFERSIWVWNINDFDEFIKFCKERMIDTIYLNYKVNAERLFNEFNIKCLIGDSENKLSADDILKIVKNADKRYKAIHYDIELAKGESIIDYNDKLRRIIKGSKSLGLVTELDVETWRKDSEYFRIIKKADSIILMGYENTAVKTIKVAKEYDFMPFTVGIETNPNLDFSMAKLGKKGIEEAVKQINKSFLFNGNYKGISFHCWGYWNKLA